MSSPGEDLVVIAHLERTRGNKGELAGVALSRRPERVKRALVRGVALDVEEVWFHGDRVIFKFQGIDSISDAEPLAGADVCIPKEERLPLEEGEFYHTDLIGCEVVDGAGRVLGRVENFQESGGPALLAVRRENGKELLIPFVKAFCRTIDVERRRIEVELPEGLEELE
jgi:16S rRNA processing protein RimM